MCIRNITPERRRGGICSAGVQPAVARTSPLGAEPAQGQRETKWRARCPPDSRRDAGAKKKEAMKATIVEKAVAPFLQSLRQRNASIHTIKAYNGDLAEFSAYVGSRSWKEIDHVTIRGFLSRLYEKGLGK